MSKLTLKDLASHLKTYAELFVKPRKVWKIIISNRQSGYELLIQHIIYYFLLCFLIIGMEKGALPFVFLDVVLTLVPFLILILPFLFFNKVLKLDLSPKSLFNLLAIIKIQIATIIFVYTLIASSFNYDFLYYHQQKFMTFGFLLFVIIFPCLIGINFFKKFLWIISNYFFLLIYYSIISFVVIKKFQDKPKDLLTIFSQETPDVEFFRFELSEERAFLETLDQKRYILLVDDNKVENQTLFATQPVTNSLYLSYQALLNKQIKDSMNFYNPKGTKTFNYLISDMMTSFIRKIPGIKPLTLQSLDSFRTDINDKLVNLYNLSDSLKDKAKFESNKEYFNRLFLFIKSYRNLYNDSNLENVAISFPLINTIDLTNNYYASLYNLDNFQSEEYNRFIELEESYADRIQNSYILDDIIYYPVNKIFENMTINALNKPSPVASP